VITTNEMEAVIRAAKALDEAFCQLPDHQAQALDRGMERLMDATARARLRGDLEFPWRPCGSG